EQSENPTPGEVSRNLLSAIALELGSRDRMAIVTYGSTVETVLPLTNGQDQVTIQGAIDRLTTGGVTDMEGGMRRAYHLAAEAERQTDEVRVMVFTDVRPNVGATTATEFERLARTGSEQDVGLTVMAVGLGLGQEVLNAMSQIRGGNAFSLFDNQDVGDLMEDDWPWLLSPLAYDMRVALTLAPGYAVAESFGFPTGADEDKPMPELEVSTIFLSRRKGALLVRLVPEEAGDLTGLNVTGQLSYTTPAGELIEQQLDMAYGHLEPDAAGQFFEQASVGKTVALALLVQTMHQAALEYAESHELAVARMRAGFERFVADAEALGDDDLTAEVELAGELLRLMESGAAQGDLYEFGVY
ncbi:MAG: VWA domain-containing protein, partial [Phycisphaerae bacterium]